MDLTPCLRLVLLPTLGVSGSPQGRWSGGRCLGVMLLGGANSLLTRLLLQLQDSFLPLRDKSPQSARVFSH